ncbi:ABC transporter permease [Cupriavidus sp. SK-3]|uniref:ABC transporter substrate-binding protein n=1 Tax=Cupriavidus sp. SK-3 TaxID=1470558 RepID=UPI000445C2B5|nr:ABC transporter substrate-binding protein [Cupriavidus sp. SK-3]KDP86599.1 ABC transporter permease [Cupriavidus sp. SK-3]
MKFKEFAAAVTACLACTAHAQVSDDTVKIGVLNDLSGVYSDLSGQGSVIAARLAVEEVGGKVLGKPVEVIFADHQNKPDVAANLARSWFDQGKVDMVTDFPTASTALAVMEIARQKNRITMPSSGLATAILGEKCSPLNAQWTANTYALAAGTARALVKEGKKTWYFITADYTFGQSLERDATQVINADGGKVLGMSRHPFPGNDFSSFLLKAQASKADVIALANAGNDTVNAIKQANEYGITRKQIVAPLLTYISDIHSIGLEKAQNMYLTEAFYWDYDEPSRVWSRKFFEKAKRMPTAAQAGVYSATLSYLKAVQAAGTDEAKAVMAQLRKMTINDAVIRNGKLREDGALVHDMLLLQVKRPAESKAAWDYYKVKAVLKGPDVFPPVNPACPITK